MYLLEDLYAVTISVIFFFEKGDRIDVSHGGKWRNKSYKQSRHDPLKI